MKESVKLPWEFLEKCSDTMLEGFLLSENNKAANILKTMHADLKELVTARVNGEIAYLLLRRGRELARIADLREGVVILEERTTPALSPREPQKVEPGAGVSRQQGAHVYGEGKNLKRSA